MGVGKLEGSAGNVVYNGKTKDGEDRRWMLAWSNNRLPIIDEEAFMISKQSLLVQVHTEN
ncbi:hypothetical protein Pyn_27906 [Prunus yedoensis var. nudiflora]|uniref:Uncharacterized protein n=1 Tax=Prunus yedoensis var. nudiflora TaxID=2094558 RepID=A0A314UDY4_PRUYE|nr:hypothetical protein Pyn_27906 [Prunus yedoensis var. nudiflora]